MSIIEHNDKEYTRFESHDLESYAKTGEPNVLGKGIYILLPQGKKPISITAKSENVISFGVGYDIEPVQEQLPVSKISIEKNQINNNAVHSSYKLFPGSLYTNLGIQSFRGYNILVLRLNPIQYNAIDGEIIFYQKIKLDITLKNDNENTLYRDTKHDEFQIKKMVDNKDIISTYKCNEIKPLVEEQYDLVIITPDFLEDCYRPLKSYHESNGIKTLIKPVEEIYSNYEGVDKQEKIRNYIRFCYQNYGIEYVLLGGDNDTIPARRINMKYLDIPSDLYYSCLDGPYNYDEDEFWGETNDGENGEDVDMTADVYLGRACTDNPQDVENFICKTVSYLNTDPNDTYLKKVINVAEYLFPFTWGSSYMDELIDECDTNGHTTEGIPSDRYDVFRLYDSLFYNWDKQDLISKLNQGKHIVNHLGHSFYHWNMKLQREDMPLLTNDKYFFEYSQGCNAGGFDDPNGKDCIAEYLTIKTKNAAFAGIYNTREGLGIWLSTDGASQHFHREFWDAVFGEDIITISKANEDSKQDNLWRVDNLMNRWIYFELTYFGDPTISFVDLAHQSNEPEKPARPQGAVNGKKDEQYTYSTSTIDPDGDQIYYRWDWGDGTFSKWVGPYDSGDTMSYAHSWYKNGNYNIRVKAKDVYGKESTWSDPLSVSMPKNKLLNNRVYLKTLVNFLVELLNR